MRSVDDGERRKTIQEIWDWHGSYQWTYFTEQAKQLIAHFLGTRLQGKALDVGGGWYLHYPDSVVIDVSPVCLEHNLAQEKVQFDLDTLSQGARLPFSDSTFDAATFVSSWQYLEHPDAVMHELDRVLKPGAECYIINAQGAGLEQAVVGFKKSDEVAAFLKARRYDVLIEHIPCLDGSVRDFHSVCASRLPLKDKARRLQENKKRIKKPNSFLNAFAEVKVAQYRARLQALEEHPVTDAWLNYQETAHAFSKELQEQTGLLPLLFTDATPPERHLLIPGEYVCTTLVPLVQIKSEVNASGKLYQVLEQLGKRYSFTFSPYPSYFGCESRSALMAENGEAPDAPALHHVTEFLTSEALNEPTKRLQAELYQHYHGKISDLDARLARARVAHHFFLVGEHKQRSKADQLQKRKAALLNGGISGVSVVRQERGAYSAFADEFKQLVLEVSQICFD